MYIYMFIQFVFIFFIGSTLGWIIELIFRRLYHKKWINPGFLVGPYLPIYGFGLVTVTGIYYALGTYEFSPIVMILLMGLCMTILELIGGEIALKNHVRLWDYRDRWGNYKGIICPLFSLIWTLVGALYYYFIAPHIEFALEWFSQNLLFSYVLGIFSGVVVIDLFYSTKLYIKIRKYAKENGITVRYEQLKMHIKDIQKTALEKTSFILPFKQIGKLKEYLDDYTEKILRR